ncbi:Mediator of RNA polymerase II transcription subunit 7 [Mortierella sp. AD011]|nr:Mediator of RNA polymerase II transcription subunit 7 [Mortierella sp. AD010]KAF9400941.1 Mediator of RNA polymerase II transcription subunit 7 [Mortierella sp. AD011]
MEEASAQQQGAAFPAPPYYFQRYTQENINLLEKAKADPENAEITKSLEALSFPILALEPPPPVKKGAYWMFGRAWPVQDSLATLEEQGIEQLYPKGSIDRVKELKKLNHSAVFNFLELVHTLSTSPGEFATKVDQIRVIFINMHHIINEYRPHQARETLKLMMEDQLNRKKKETAALRKTCTDLRKQLATLQALKQERLQPPELDTDVEMSAPASSQSHTSSSTTAISTTTASSSTASGVGTKLSRRLSGSEDKRKSIVDSAPLDPIAIKNAETLARMMSLCDNIE